MMQETKEIRTQLGAPPADAAPLNLTAVAGQELQLTAGQLKGLSPEQIYRLYQTYIKELSTQLVLLNTGDKRSAVTLEVGGWGGAG